MKKDDIINAAIDEFGSYDYDRASTNTIIEKSHTSKGTFYHYFESKEVLYLEVIKKLGEEKKLFLQHQTNQLKPSSEEDTIFEMLRNQIELSMRFSLTYPNYARLSAKIANETNQDIKEKVLSVIGQVSSDYYSELIKRDIADHKIRSDLPQEFVCQLFLYLIAHFNDFIVSSGLKIEPQHTTRIMEQLRYYIDFIENGLKPENLSKE